MNLTLWIPCLAIGLLIGCATPGVTYAEPDFPEIPAVKIAVAETQQSGWTMDHKTSGIHVRSVIFNKKTDMWEVFIERMPPMPGAHAIYYVSQDNKIVKITGGR